ncbi:hypothetical protein C8J57DRAFT_1231664 [Mycena rebaudengoi]|nr:hypothetical protein C8J57DRAFT_1231664 [Mycena rebaudengoi]
MCREICCVWVNVESKPDSWIDITQKLESTSPAGQRHGPTTQASHTKTSVEKRGNAYILIFYLPNDKNVAPAPAANSSRTTRTYHRCSPPARWHEHRLILRIALSLGPNTPFTAYAVSGGECAGAPAGTGNKTAALSEATRSEGAALAEIWRGHCAWGRIWLRSRKWFPRSEKRRTPDGWIQGRGDDGRNWGAGSPEMMEACEPLWGRLGSGGESELGNYIVDVFVDVLLTAGFRGGRELPVVAERSPRRSRCWCARRRVDTVGKAPETREAAAQAGRGAIAEKIAVLLPRLQGTRGEQGGEREQPTGSKVEAKRAGCLRTSAERRREAEAGGLKIRKKSPRLRWVIEVVLGSPGHLPARAKQKTARSRRCPYHVSRDDNALIQAAAGPLAPRLGQGGAIRVTKHYNAAAAEKEEKETQKEKAMPKEEEKTKKGKEKVATHPLREPLRRRPCGERADAVQRVPLVLPRDEERGVHYLFVGGSGCWEGEGRVDEGIWETSGDNKAGKLVARARVLPTRRDITVPHSGRKNGVAQEQAHCVSHFFVRRARGKHACLRASIPPQSVPPLPPGPASPLTEAATASGPLAQQAESACRPPGSRRTKERDPARAHHQGQPGVWVSIMRAESESGASKALRAALPGKQVIWVGDPGGRGKKNGLDHALAQLAAAGIQVPACANLLLRLLEEALRMQRGVCVAEERRGVLASSLRQRDVLVFVSPRVQVLIPTAPVVGPPLLEH